MPRISLSIASYTKHNVNKLWSLLKLLMINKRRTVSIRGQGLKRAFPNSHSSGIKIQTLRQGLNLINQTAPLVGLNHWQACKGDPALQWQVASNSHHTGYDFRNKWPFGQTASHFRTPKPLQRPLQTSFRWQIINSLKFTALKLTFKNKRIKTAVKDKVVFYIKKIPKSVSKFFFSFFFYFALLK